MKIMITGAGGQLGQDCQRVFGATDQVSAFGHQELDITRQAVISETVGNIRPDLIINCAAHTGVDACETETALARELNVSGPRFLAESAACWGSLLVHISTDYVFDGQKPITEGYAEADEPRPLSVYGKTKLAGERAISEVTENYIILRTAWLYGIQGHNFLKKMLKLNHTNPSREFKVVNDQFGSPTWSFRLAQQIKNLVEKDARGLYHATAEGVCTWYDLADYFLEKMNVPHRLVPCTSEEFPTAAVRPKNSILENRRLEEAGINIMAPWQDDVAQYTAQFAEQLLQSVAA
ncbi:MAG: dTDP-4-dehydrorhamnose reductase [Deltaproteobacteria bacterium]|nr:dTDP-4-dehydrorhamnose reductase [Deltaproteobacteria bacterium]